MIKLAPLFDCVSVCVILQLAVKGTAVSDKIICYSIFHLNEGRGALPKSR